MSLYSRRKYYCYHQNLKWLWCHPIIHISNIAIAILDFSLLLLVKLSLLILFGSFLVSVLCFFYGSLSKVIALPTIAIAIVVALSRNYCCRISWQSHNYMGSNTEKKPWTNLQNLYKNLSKEIKSDNFCYCKVGRPMTKWGAIEKSPILRYYHFKGKQKLFRILMVEIIFSPTVNPSIQAWIRLYARTTSEARRTATIWPVTQSAVTTRPQQPITE